MTTICYYSATATELFSLSQACRELRRAHPDVEIWARTQSQLFDVRQQERFIQRAMAADIVVITLHGGIESFPTWEQLNRTRIERQQANLTVPYLHIQPCGGDDEALALAQTHSDGIDNGTWHRLSALLVRGGSENTQRALSALVELAKGNQPVILEPISIPYEGIYHPVHGTFSNFDSYRPYLDPTRPTVGILFYQTYWLNHTVAHVDALISAIETQGGNVIAVFGQRLKDRSLGNRGSDEIFETFFKRDGKAQIDVLVSVMSMSMTIAEKAFATVLPELDVPVLQALSSSVPRKQWEEGTQGLSTMDVTFQAAQPEFDGNLITLPIATREEDTFDPFTGALLMRIDPIEERVERMAELSLRWANLRRKANADKRVAIVFHHYPPRNDRIGCASGLDSFESVRLLLERMRADGYRINHLYESADELTQDLLRRLTCDARWLSATQMAERAEAKAERALFEPWFSELPEAVQTQMRSQWGNIPGTRFVHDDQLLFAGHINGNVFLTIQPPRGDIEKAADLAHDLTLSPPHHYLAHYRWIRDVFQADAVIHVGTHGSLEWLPGKALGLSHACYPDLALGTLPNIYPYIINNPGEGTQAKRRSACALVDHLTPPFRNADLYEDLAIVERAVNDYADAKAQDPSKLHVLAKLAWDAVVKADLHHDLAITETEALSDTESFMERVHCRLTELADTQISDGLHTLGQLPNSTRLEEYLVQLTRLPNGSVPSLRESIARCLGFDYDDLLTHKGERLSRYQERTGGQVILEIHATARSLVEALSNSGYASTAIRGIVTATLKQTHSEIETTLNYIATSLVPRLREVTREMSSILRSLSGRFVEPGPSGAPTRGRADILPSGRNFYSIDPRSIPNRAAWEVGKALGEALLARYQSEEGNYPENVGIIVWGSSTMRTHGDDIAEILYLMGLQPHWLTNGLVAGLEVIPLTELRRPRIDVTPRISGFFRDAFPNLVELLDEAARLVAALEESPENNFLRGHALSDQEQYRNEGATDEEAWRMATVRVFGCPPGTYGAGVAELVEAKAWKTKNDLGEAYIRYSAHAYGKGLYGKSVPNAFRRQLSRMDATVKNEDSREYDMLSCTDFYNYYGGLIAAATTVRGKKPVSLVGDTSDPKRVSQRSTEEEAKHILRARLLNPAWIEGLKRHGYKGAGDLSKVLDIIIGWDATADVMEDWMYERVANRYALDPEMQNWFKKANPYALHNILDKLLETIERGMWNATSEMKQELQDAFLSTEGDVEEALDN
jgi:cobaltochelatase CobN